MLLAIDMGNTQIVFGVFDQARLIADWRLKTRLDRTSDEYGIDCLNLMKIHNLQMEKIDGLIISSVVPNLDSVIEAMCQRYFNASPLFVDGTTQDCLQILYNPPTDVGADRIVNAVAAFVGYGAPLIVLDFGTATTFDAVNRTGEYMGGAIVPGIKVSSEALYQKTARLPGTAIAKPVRAIGRTMVESIQSGLYFGSLFMIKGLVDTFKQELGKDTKVIATGGMMDIFRSDMPWVTAFDRNLTMDGLYYIYSNLKK